MAEPFGYSGRTDVGQSATQSPLTNAIQGQLEAISSTLTDVEVFTTRLLGSEGATPDVPEPMGKSGGYPS